MMKNYRKLHRAAGYWTSLLVGFVMSVPGPVFAQTKVTLGLASNFSDVSTSTANPFGNYFRDGIALALDESAARLKANHLQVSTMEFNYETSTVKALQAARDAAASDAVTVVGYNWSSHALIAAPVHQENKLPMISPSATADRLSHMGPYVHTACFDNSSMAEGLAKFAKEKLHAKSASIVVASDCAYCRDLADVFRLAFERRGGRIVSETPILEREEDFAAVSVKVKAANPDVIFIPNQELLSAKIIAGLQQSGINRPFLGGDGWGDVGEQFFKILNGQSLEAYTVSHWHASIKEPRSLSFMERYKKRFHRAPNDTAVLAYDATLLFVEALIRAKSKDRAGIEAALANMKTFEGVTGKFRFRPNQPTEKSIVLLKNANHSFEVIDQISPK